MVRPESNPRDPEFVRSYIKSPSQARHFMAVNQMGIESDRARLESRGKGIAFADSS